MIFNVVIYNQDKKKRESVVCVTNRDLATLLLHIDDTRYVLDAIKKLNVIDKVFDTNYQQYCVSEKSGTLITGKKKEKRQHD